VRQSMVPTMMHMGATITPRNRPLNALRMGAFSDSAGEFCSWTWDGIWDGISTPQRGQKRQGDERCAPHFEHSSVIGGPSLRVRNVALENMPTIGRASHLRADVDGMETVRGDGIEAWSFCRFAAVYGRGMGTVVFPR
jgi:hypothetical protein